MGMKLKEAPSKTGAFPAHEMVLGEDYMTAQSPWPKQTPCRLVKVDYVKHKVLLSAWYNNFQEWSDVWVEWDYKIRHQTKEEEMKIKVKKAAQPSNGSKAPSKTKGTTTGVGIHETWGIAFGKFALEKDAPKKITEFMRKEYPGRKTPWERWINAVRQRYNRGEFEQKPKDRVEPYEYDPKTLKNK